ncbi:hypothetical protein [Halorussus litoreus]|uniref:hypothetical protein n=1 Tax=Halorussus litoreus TaxID=1710536 RepID=UPI001300236E|nr:hypothetical protein [Halorussus litoreus]
MTNKEPSESKTSNGMNRRDILKVGSGLSIGTLLLSSDNGKIATIDERDADIGGDGAILDIREYDADPTGRVESDSAFEAAIADADEGDTILFQDGEFLIEDDTHVINKSLTIKGVNATLLRSTHGWEMTPQGWGKAAIAFRGGGPTGEKTQLSDNVSRGDSSIPVSNINLFQVGDRVQVREGSQPGELGQGVPAFKFQLGKIEKVDTEKSKIWLTDNLGYDISAANGEVEIIKLIQNPSIEGLKADSGAGTADWFLMEWVEDGTYRNITTWGGSRFIQRFNNSWGVQNIRPKASHADSEGPGEGEMIYFGRCNDVFVSSPHVEDCRRGVDLTKGTHGVTVFNPHVYNFKSTGISQHNDLGNDITIIGGHLTANPTNTIAGDGIEHRGGKMVITGTTIVPRRAGVNVKGVAENLHIDGVTVEPHKGLGDRGDVLRLNTNVDANVELAVQDPGNDLAYSASFRGHSHNNVTLNLHGDVPPVRMQSANYRNINLKGSFFHPHDRHGLYGTPGAGDLWKSISIAYDHSGGGHGVLISPQEGGMVRNLNIKGVSLTTNDMSVEIRDGLDSLRNVCITDCYLNAREGNEINIQEEDLNRAWIKNNRAPSISVHPDATNVIIEGNQ